MSDEQLTIGELAGRTGVATSALRYWEQLALFPAPTRVAGRRRYPPSAVTLVGEILLLQEVGFALNDIQVLIASRSSAGVDWRDLYRRKLVELDQRIAHTQVARTAIAHALACRHDDIHDCPSFVGVVTARLSGASFVQAHPDHCRRRSAPVLESSEKS